MIEPCDHCATLRTRPRGISDAAILKQAPRLGAPPSFGKRPGGRRPFLRR